MDRGERSGDDAKEQLGKTVGYLILEAQTRRVLLAASDRTFNTGWDLH